MELKASWGERFWGFTHNCVAHPLLGVLYLLCGYYPEWADSFHNWTARH